MKEFKIAIDLLWVKHGKVGGIETYVINLLNGISTIDNHNQYILIVSNDNYKVFQDFERYDNFRVIKCNVVSEKVLKTVIWENLHLDDLVTELNADFCFVPYYRMPILKSKNKYLITVHDLQALHFPEYFSRGKNLWLRFYWSKVMPSADHIVAISNFVKKDIEMHYKIGVDKTSVIYNPILIKKKRDISPTLQRNNLREGEYYYTISSLLKHKNLITILKALVILKNKGYSPKLVITGIKGSAESDITTFIHDNALADNCIYTGYITDEEKFDLIRGCRKFLFPSIFEGFGMPPIEAMLCGKQVITTNCTCIPEVTMNKAIYVTNPFDAEEWAMKMNENNHVAVDTQSLIEEYSPENIAKKYIALFESM